MTDPFDASTVARPATTEGAKAFIVTPFAKVARTHAASTMADAMVAASLAGSLFFNLPADGARGPVLRYLVITMLPFAVISPLIGPLIDRMKGGHRLMVIGSAVVRVLICYLLIGQITGESTVFFLLALCLLVGQKAYQVARSALVPTVVRSDAELVEANSKLSLISGISGFLGVVPAGILLKLFGAQWSVGLAMLTYVVAAVLGLQIPRSRVAVESADETEKIELRGAGIIMAGSAMGLIRGCVGFLTLLVAFDFRGGDRPTWQFGLVGGASVLSQLAGAAVAPRLRKLTSEENILSGVLGLLVVGGFLSLLLDEVMGATILGACVGFAAGAGKLAFDSILQRDAPDANRGRAFAKFETRFQVTWVIGALLPVAITMGASVGFAVVFAIAVTALGTYTIARLSYAHRTGSHQSAATAAAVEIEDRFAEVSGEVKDRLGRAPRAAYRRLRSGRSVDPATQGYYVPEDDGVDGFEAYGHEAYPPAPDAHESYGPGAGRSAADRSGSGAHGGYAPDPDEPYDEDAEPQWADESPSVAAHAAPVDEDHVRRRGRRRRSAAATAEAPTVAVDRSDPDLAAGSPLAWHPDAPTGVPDEHDEPEFPWEPPADEHEASYLDDVDPSVANPYPWTPDPDPSPRGGREF